MKRKTKLKRLSRWLFTLILIILLIFGIIYGTRLVHIFLTSTGRSAPDVPNSDTYPVQGVDISYYQGNVNWETLSQQGITFAYVKATEGIDYTDSQFSTNWTTGNASSVYLGAYHFWRFEDSGAEQAEHFIETVPKTENTLPPVIDVEIYESLGDDVKPDPAETVTQLRIMAEKLEEYYGVAPILYVAPNTYRWYGKQLQSDYPIWISNYYYEPYFHWTFWQYCNDGILEGYDGEQIHIDLNVYEGSYSEFIEDFKLEEK